MIPEPSRNDTPHLTALTESKLFRHFQFALISPTVYCNFLVYIATILTYGYHLIFVTNHCISFNGHMFIFKYLSVFGYDWLTEAVKVPIVSVSLPVFGTWPESCFHAKQCSLILKKCIHYSFLLPEEIGLLWSMVSRSCNLCRRRHYFITYNEYRYNCVC